MADARESLDHRDRHRLLPRRRARTRTGSALNDGTAARRRDDVCALSRASRRAARSRQADPEEGRSAPDGAVAAHRHLCGGPRARQRRREGQRRAARAHGHDRRGRRRRARRAGRPRRRWPASPRRTKPEAFVNERLMNDLRPTLFLAQLSNLLAGNISIVHGVTGSSRTFMGEEAGRRRRGAHRACAHRGGAERPRAGRRRLQCRALGSDAALRARAHAWRAASRSRCGSAARHGSSAPSGPSWCWRKRRHAQARGAKPFARSPRSRPITCRRTPGAVTGALERMWSTDRAAARSGACGRDLRRDRRRSPRPRRSARFSAARVLPCARPEPISAMGSSRSFRLTSRSRRRRCEPDKLFPPATIGVRAARWTAPLRQVVVTSIGHWRGEGLALVEAVELRESDHGKAIKPAGRSSSSPAWAS